jgi:hypothetical protein
MAHLSRLLFRVCVCCGTVLLVLALIAVPENVVQGDDGSGGSGQQVVGRALCILSGDPTDGCLFTVDPCFPMTCTAPKGAAKCDCK